MPEVERLDWEPGWQVGPFSGMSLIGHRTDTGERSVTVPYGTPRYWALPSRKLTKDELEAIQWDSLEEEMAGSAEYDIVPDYDKLLDIMSAAKRAG